MKISTKDEIIADFVCVIGQIDKKHSCEIESNLQTIISKVRPHIHKVI